MYVQARILAFLMGAHARLGAQSHVNGLVDVTEKIANLIKADMWLVYM